MHGDTPEDLIAWRTNSAEDDQRRAKSVETLLNKAELVLDVGCGAGGFIHELRSKGVHSYGIELDQVARDFLASEDLGVWQNLTEMPESTRIDIKVVTMFHVLEHIRDPREFLREAIAALPNVRLFVFEVPSSEDPLLNLYQCEAFSHFTYWSHHEQLHTKWSLDYLLNDLFGDIKVTRLQRYGIGNHLGWLSTGKPGGQHQMPFAEENQVDVFYRSALISQGFSDSLWAECHISPLK